MRINVFLASGLALLTAFAAAAQTPVPLNVVPSRIVGHPPEPPLNPLNQWPNLVEGREFFNPYGIALDTSVSPPAIYVADTGNNRVLGWKNALGFRNGDKADIVIGQQGSFQSTAAQGPGTNFSSGMSSPAGLAVDTDGNLYVADQGNNRILRFPKPFAQQGGQFPDLYVGQVNLNSNRKNYTGAVSDQGLDLSDAIWPAQIAFDAQKNLWVVDGGNRRVLRFAAADVAAGGGPKQANLVIGQLDFTSVAPSVTAATRTTPNFLAPPSGIAFDAAGRLYVSDGAQDRSVGRVLVFTPPFSNNQSAARMMGVITATSTTQDVVDKTLMTGPSSIFFIPSASKMGVLDTLSHRILLFDTFDKWPDPATSFSPLATGVIGQPNFNNRGINSTTNVWAPGPTASTFSGPSAAVYSSGTNELFLADTGNNRVLAMPFVGGTFAPATRLLGQDFFTTSGINLVEGREFAFLNVTNAGFNLDAGLALDETGDTPHLYVADTYNHRILGFRDFRKAQAGAKADIVIGQPDFVSNLCNITGNPDGATASSLCVPTGLVVDPQGNLYVADTANARVLRFPAPFARQGQLPQADLVLGQRNFTSKVTDPSNSTMSQPYGLALSATDGLFVSDVRYNRVLFFRYTANNTFAGGTDNGRAASKVFGQPDFTTVTSGNTDSALAAPHHVAVDSEGRLYVADAGNGRVVIFDQVNLTPNAGAHAAFGFQSAQPRGILVNPSTGEIWVSEGGSALAKRYPRYGNLLLNPAPTFTVAAGSNALAVAQDQYGDLVIADASSRVGMYFPAVQGYNGANFLASRPSLAPGLLASLCSPSSTCDPAKTSKLFGTNTQANTDLPISYPMPRTLGDVQVLFGPTGEDLAPVPLYYVSPSQINFVVPMNAPTSGFVDIQVVQPSTGRVYAAGILPMNTVSPGIIQLQYTGNLRQAAVLNLPGNTVNGPTNAAPRGSYVSLYATGQGFVPGAPPDGVPPSGAIATPLTPRIAINNIFLDQYILNPEDQGKQLIQYSGLSPYPGVWQINFYIPTGVVPGAQIPVLILAGSSTTSSDGSFTMTIAVK